MRLLNVAPAGEATALPAPNQRGFANPEKIDGARGGYLLLRRCQDSLKLERSVHKGRRRRGPRPPESFLDSTSKAADSAKPSSFLDSSSRRRDAASSKATFEAAQSALKVVDSDAVKNALKAGDGAADATAQAIRGAPPMLYPPSRSTPVPSTRRRNERPRPRRRPPGTAPRSANSKPRTSGKNFPSTRRASTEGFAAAGQKISASVDAKTLTTNLDAGMKQLGKNLGRRRREGDPGLLRQCGLQAGVHRYEWYR